MDSEVFEGIVEDLVKDGKVEFRDKFGYPVTWKMKDGKVACWSNGKLRARFDTYIDLHEPGVEALHQCWSYCREHTNCQECTLSDEEKKLAYWPYK